MLRNNFHENWFKIKRVTVNLRLKSVSDAYTDVQIYIKYILVRYMLFIKLNKRNIMILMVITWLGVQ